MTISGSVLTVTMLVGSAGAFLAFARRCKHDWECIAASNETKEGIFFCRKCKRRKLEKFIWW